MKNKHYFLLATITTLWIILLGYKAYFIQNTFDDAYMFLRYAFNLIEYGNYGWNKEIPAYGCTSIAYVFANVILFKIGLQSILELGQLASLHAIFWFLSGFFIIGITMQQTIVKFAKYKSLIICLSLCLLMINPLIYRTALTGMDTGMSFAFNSLLIFSAIKFSQYDNWKNLIIMTFFAYFTFLVRPDNGIYMLLFPLLFLVFYTKSNILTIVTHVSLLLLLGIIDTTIKYYYFGHVLPIPFYVKSAGFYASYTGILQWNTWDFLADWILWASPFIFLSVFCFDKKKLLKTIAFTLPLILTIAYLATTVQIMGTNSRLFIPSLPYLAILPALFIGQSSNIIKEFTISNNIKKGTLLFASILISILFLKIGGKYHFEYKQELAENTAKKYELSYQKYNKITQLGWWEAILEINEFIEQTDQDFIIAATEHGYISSQNMTNQILCLAGLHNKLVVKTKSLNKEIIFQSISTSQPDLIWLHPDYKATQYYMLNLDYFKKNYEYYHGIMNYGVSIRKNSKYYDQMIDFFKKIHKIDKLQPTIYKAL